MIHTIQDDIIRRALDFFGLRGVVRHDYEATVIPSVSVGHLGQPTRWILSTSTNINSPFIAVPAGKCWRPLYWFGSVTQAGGVTARTYSIGWQFNGLLSGIFPFYRSTSNGNDISNENIQRQMTLNTTDNFVVIFPRDFILPSGALLSIFALAGDGTTTTPLGATLFVHELGENLVLQG